MGIVLKILPRFAAELLGISPLTVTKSGLQYTVSYSNPNVITQQIFTSSGTYTPTANMVKAIVECVGGGGGGGGALGSASTQSSGGGGGSGGYSRVVVTAALIGISKTVTVGAGGTGGAAGFNPGTNGGDTSLGTLCIALGGAGGGGATPGTGGPGGDGGFPGTGTVKAEGTDGGRGIGASILTVDGISGYGAPSHFGGGARGVRSTAGLIGQNYGAGGSGGAVLAADTSLAGGNGSAGVVIITEFNSK